MNEHVDHKIGITLPLSPVQQGMFFHYIHKKNRHYLEQMICDIIGEPDIDIVERSLNKLIEQYDALRTVFLHKGVESMRQVIIPHKTIRLDYRDLSNEAHSQQYIDQCIAMEADKHLELSKEAYRCKLFRVGKSRYVFLWTYHHLIMDSWTIRLLQDDFCKIYYHEKEGIPYSEAASYSYQLYLDWIKAQDQEKAKTYWKDYLSNYSGAERSVLPVIDALKKKKTLEVPFEPGVRQLIDEISNQQRTTINSVVLAAWGAYVLDHFHENEIIFGVVTFGRMMGLKNVDKIAGLFVNSIPLYVKRDAPASELITRLQRDTFMAARYSYLSLSDIMACGNLRPADIRTFLNFSIDEEELNNNYSSKLPFQVKNIWYNEEANYDVYLDVYLKEDSFSIRIYYDMDSYFFDALQVRDRVTQILRSFAAQPQLPVKDVLNNLVINEALSNDASFNF